MTDFEDLLFYQLTAVLDPTHVTIERECKFLHGYSYHTATYYKCTKYGVSHGQATDWRLKYPACGRFEPGNPAIPSEAE